MGIDMIGKQIAAMRKEKGIRQEELAGFVGVSTQAVSKWENGGVPDTELIPKIADFFSVSIDTLFGRELTGYSDAQAALMRRISEAPQDERIGMIFDCCWAMERASCGETRQAETSLDECGKAIAPDLRFTRRSSKTTDSRAWESQIRGSISLSCRSRRTSAPHILTALIIPAFSVISETKRFLTPVFS